LAHFFGFFQCFFGHLKKLLLKNEEILINKGGRGKIRPRITWTAKFLFGERKTISCFLFTPGRLKQQYSNWWGQTNTKYILMGGQTNTKYIPMDGDRLMQNKISCIA